MKSVVMCCASLSILVGVALASSGCAQGSKEENIDETQEAVGAESGCATVSIASSINGGTLTYAEAFSPTTIVESADDQYNATTSACPNQFVVEIANNYNSRAPAWNTWDQPLPTNSTDCAAARVQMYWYGYNGTSWSGSLGKDYRGGVWNSGTSTCSFPPSMSVGNQTGDYDMTTMSSYSKIRLAVRAWQWVNFKVDSKFVAVSYVHLPS